MVGQTPSGPGSKNPIKIMANIFISFIGAGVLGLPYAFKEAGIIEGFVIMTAVGLISVKAMLLIIDCKYKLTQKGITRDQPDKSLVLRVGDENKEEHVELLQRAEKQDLQNGHVSIEEPKIPIAPGEELSYGDVAYYAMGNSGRLSVEIAIVVSQIGFCCAYLIFISENLGDYIKGLNIVHWLCIMLPPLTLLTFLRHLSSLSYSSLFAQFSNLLAFLVVFWFDFEHYDAIEIHPKKISAKGFPFFLAISIYCYEGAGMILSLEASVDKSIRHQFRYYFKLTLFFVTMLYIFFGMCGYLSFGPQTNPIITLNLPKGQSLDFAMIVKTCLCLALFFTYPVMMFPVIGILEIKLIPNPGERIWHGNLLRILLVLLTGMVVLAVPNFANLMALVGASCCTLLAFILPGVFHYKIHRDTMSRWQVAFDVFLVLLGIVGTAVGTWDALMRLGDTHAALKQAAMAVPTTTPVATTASSSAVTSLTTALFTNETDQSALISDVVNILANGSPFTNRTGS